jgi:hypothetical protein
MSFSSGVINCPPDRVEQCQSFRDEVESEGSQSIDLEAAPSGGTSEGETGKGETGEGETDAETTEEPSPDSTDGGG